jgi:hypothetical protein
MATSFQTIARHVLETINAAVATVTTDHLTSSLPFMEVVRMKDILGQLRRLLNEAMRQLPREEPNIVVTDHDILARREELLDAHFDILTKCHLIKLWAMPYQPTFTTSPHLFAPAIRIVNIIYHYGNDDD